MPETVDLLRALQEVEKRAERVHDEQHVINTYVEAGALVNALMARDNGVVLGRRGTGKTHTLRYLAEKERARGNFVVYIDMDSALGSTEGLYSDQSHSISERATRLIIDVLNIMYDALVADAFASKSDSLIDTLDRMLDHFGEVMVVDEAEQHQEGSRAATQESGATLSVDRHGPGLSASSRTAQSGSFSTSSTARGVVRHRVEFGPVASLMRRALAEHHATRCWILLDEWSSKPLDLQPYLAEMLRKLFFGLPKVTVRVGAIPHRTEWRVQREAGGYIGVEIGAELFPVLDLDEFVVFPARSREEQATRAADFFKNLLHRHLSQILSEEGIEPPRTADNTVSLLFTQVTALNELVRAAEGVPRDAITIVSRAALRAGERKISTDHIRAAAAQVYQSTKAALLNGIPDARSLLERIIAEVISEKRARAFLLQQDYTEHPLIRQLIDDRLLHLIKRGYSSNAEPGTRFDVLQIDYGCYVQLLATGSAPQTLFDGLEDDAALRSMYDNAVVPEDDYRAIRRAVLDLPELLEAVQNAGMRT